MKAIGSGENLLSSALELVDGPQNADGWSQGPWPGASRDGPAGSLSGTDVSDGQWCSTPAEPCDTAALQFVTHSSFIEGWSAMASSRTACREVRRMWVRRGRSKCDTDRQRPLGSVAGCFGGERGRDSASCTAPTVSG